MLFVSDNAKSEIALLMNKDQQGDDYFVRVSVKAGGCSGLSYDMTFDNKLNDGDEVFEDKGVKIVCDVRSLLYLMNTTLDFSSGLNGKGFQFVNPNASRTCGCGESFSV
jgi:iron-sulfur cluster assembly protein